MDEQYQLSQGECWDAEVCVALHALETRDMPEADLSGGSLLFFLDVPFGTLSVLQNEFWHIAPLCSFCLSLKCQENYEEDRTPS